MKARYAGICPFCSRPVAAGDSIMLRSRVSDGRAVWGHYVCPSLPKPKPKPQRQFTREEIMWAFRAKVRQIHPDAGGDDATAPEAMTKLLRQRDELLRGARD